jgi:hypothetical protein
MVPAQLARADNLSVRRACQVDEPGQFQFSVALLGDGARGCGVAAPTSALPDAAVFVGPSHSIDDCALLVDEAASGSASHGRVFHSTLSLTVISTVIP